ncbi:MAG TPA: hypothetical protein EYN71_09105 [Flavobacteriales bacterium]|nr:hypothetical protein [Flavobacteriales bacterium]HIO67838.1 hypothetical protein [Flavobacteriales bacterium]
MEHTFSGAIAPFGLVQLSPQTNFEVMFNDDGSYNGEPMNTALATNIEIPLTITANNQSKRSIYVDKILVNGEVLEGTLLSHDVIINGGEIVFEMSSTPDQ